MSNHDLSSKIILTESFYINDIFLYGGNVKKLPFNGFEDIVSNNILSKMLEVQKNMNIDGFVLEDATASYLEYIDERFKRVDPKFTALSFFLIFPKEIDKKLMENINSIILKLHKTGITYENINGIFFNGMKEINKIHPNFMHELLIILGVALAMSILFPLLKFLFFFLQI